MTTTLNSTTDPVTRRPTTLAANPREIRDWQDYANCLTSDPETFFPVGDGKLARAQEEAAKLVCGNCWVRAQCLDTAVRTRQLSGVWGGLTEQERAPLHDARERSTQRCVNAREWVDAELARGRTQKSVAQELGVNPKTLRQAIKLWRTPEGSLSASDVEAAA